MKNSILKWRQSYVLIAIFLFLFSGNTAYAQYCIPTTSLNCSDGDRASHVVFAGIDDYPTCITGYNDRTATVSPASVTLGNNYSMSVTTQATDDYAAVWIDYNHNSTFDAGEFTLLRSNSTSSIGETITGTIAIPGTALTGLTRMRLRVKFNTAPNSSNACDMAGSYGEVTDYMVNIAPAGPPACATNLSPAAGATFCSGGNVTLSWTAATGATSYDVYLDGTSGTTLVSSGQTGTTYTITSPAVGSYVWKVVPKNSSGSATGCATSTFSVITPTSTPSVSIAANPGNGICAGTSVTFTATPTLGGTTPTYQWKKNGSNVGTNSATYTDNTLNNNDVIACVLTSNASCITTTTASSNDIVITIQPAPTVSITAAGPTSFCTGGSVQLNVNSNGSNPVWSRGGTVVGNGNSYLANTSGSYTVTTTIGSCAATSAAVTVTTVAPPDTTMTLSGPVTFCQGNTLTMTVPANANNTYQWTRNGANIATGNAYSATATGKYQVRITASGACTALSRIVDVTVNSAPPASATASGATSVCQGESVVLSANPGLGYSYQWYLGTNLISGATSISYLATATGNYSVEVKSGICPSKSAAIAVTINAKPAATITPMSDTNFCENGSVVLNANQGSGYTYKWYRNNQLVGNGIYSYTAYSGGYYTVQVTNTNTGCSQTSSPVLLKQTTLPVIRVSILGDTAYCAGGTALLKADQGPGYTYQWMQNGVPLSGATLPDLYTNGGGAYTVEVTNSGACRDTSDIINVTVHPLPLAPVFVYGNALSTYNIYTSYQWYRNAAAIPNANNYLYVPVQGGHYSVMVTDTNGCSNMSPVRDFGDTGTTTGVNTLELDGIRIYPNPATSVLRIDAPVPVNVQLRSIDGKIVLVQKAARELDIADLPGGVYLLQIIDQATGQLLKIERVVKMNQ